MRAFVKEPLPEMVSNVSIFDGAVVRTSNQRAFLLGAVGGSGRALGGPGKALGGAVGELWEALYIDKLLVNRPSGRVVNNHR